MKYNNLFVIERSIVFLFMCFSLMTSFCPTIQYLAHVLISYLESRSIFSKILYCIRDLGVLKDLMYNFCRT